MAEQKLFCHLFYLLPINVHIDIDLLSSGNSNNNNNNEMNRNFTKVDTETFSSNQIWFIKRILSEEELIPEQMDEVIK